jgi:hypothetical protein
VKQLYTSVINSFKWFKKSFEYRGKASARKLTTFVSAVLLNSGYLVHLYTGQIIQIEFIYILALIVFLGLGFLTAENIIEMVKGRFSQSTFLDYDQDIYTSRSRVDNPDK